MFYTSRTTCLIVYIHRTAFLASNASSALKNKVTKVVEFHVIYFFGDSEFELILKEMRSETCVQGVSY
jgi:hypothetical protein